MAYFKGNAIYLVGDQYVESSSGMNNYIELHIKDCLFKMNSGINVADGGAVHIDGKQFN